MEYVTEESLFRWLFFFQVTKQCESYVWKVQAGNDKVNFSLYYETLCPYCRQFIVSQVSKAYETILDIVNITIVPYGNAHETYEPSTQLYEYVCQHGADECVGNLIHVKSPTIFSELNFFFLDLCFEFLSKNWTIYSKNNGKKTNGIYYVDLAICQLYGIGKWWYENCVYTMCRKNTNWL